MTFPPPLSFRGAASRFFACEFAVGEALAADLGHGELEALAVVHVLAVVVAKSLLVKVAEKMKRFHTHIRARDAALQQRPEVLKAVRVYATIHVLHGMVNNLVRVIARRVRRRTCSASE